MTEYGDSNEAGSGPAEPDRSSKNAREAAWDDVAAHFSRLGQQVRERFERRSGEETAAPETRSTRETSSGETVRRWIDKLDETFTKLGDTVRDPAFRQEAGASVGRLGEALGMTLREAGEQLQGRFGRARTETSTEAAPGEPMPDVPPPPPTSPTTDAPPRSPSATPDAPTPPAGDVAPPPAPAPPEPTTPPAGAEPEEPDEQAPPA